MSWDCKGRGSAPSSHHLSPSLLEKIQHQEMLWQNTFLALHSTIHLSVVALRLASLFIGFQSIVGISDAVPFHYLLKCHNECWDCCSQWSELRSVSQSQGSPFEGVLLMSSSSSLVETCDLWDIWPERWGDLFWSTPRQRQIWGHLESTLKEGLGLGGEGRIAVWPNCLTPCENNDMS